MHKYAAFQPLAFANIFVAPHFPCHGGKYQKNFTLRKSGRIFAPKQPCFLHVWRKSNNFAGGKRQETRE